MSSPTSRTENEMHYQLSASDRVVDLLVSRPLKGTNYSTWQRLVMKSLVSKSKLGFINGSLQKPSANDPDDEDWTTCNSTVMSKILNSLMIRRMECGKN